MNTLTKLIALSDFENPRFLKLMQSIFGEINQSFGALPDEIFLDSKRWEITSALLAFENAQILNKDSKILGVGAGTEATSFYLADKVGLVVASDLYSLPGVWSDVAPSDMLINPLKYSPYTAINSAPLVVNADATNLPFPDDYFDGVYSSGSIEHFGSYEAASTALCEIARVLKVGGVASIATEFRLRGPSDLDTWGTDTMLFTPEQINQFLVVPSGLELLGVPNFEIDPMTLGTAQDLVQFLSKVKSDEITIEERRRIYPNLVLFRDGFWFCSVNLHFRKPNGWQPKKQTGIKSDALVPTRSPDSIYFLSNKNFNESSSQALPGQQIGIYSALRNLLIAMSTCSKYGKHKSIRVMIRIIGKVSLFLGSKFKKFLL